VGVGLTYAQGAQEQTHIRICGNRFPVRMLPDSKKPHRRYCAHMKKIIKMREMSEKQRGTIKRVNSTGDMGRRVREMGLVPGTEIVIQGRAPLKDPVAIKVRDFILTLRNNEADQIQVEVEDPA
jgi:ferrous iron transport protein A